MLCEPSTGTAKSPLGNWNTTIAAYLGYGIIYLNSTALCVWSCLHLDDPIAAYHGNSIWGCFAYWETIAA